MRKGELRGRTDLLLLQTVCFFDFGSPIIGKTYFEREIMEELRDVDCCHTCKHVYIREIGYDYGDTVYCCNKNADAPVFVSKNYADMTKAEKAENDIHSFEDYMDSPYAAEYYKSENARVDWEHEHSVKPYTICDSFERKWGS